MSLFINFMVITNQKSTVDTQALKGKEFSYDIRDSHQVTREESKRRRRWELQKELKKKINSTTQSSLQIQCNPYQITNGKFHRIRTKYFYNLYRNTKDPT